MAKLAIFVLTPREHLACAYVIVWVSMVAMMMTIKVKSRRVNTTITRRIRIR